MTAVFVICQKMVLLQIITQRNVPDCRWVFFYVLLCRNVCVCVIVGAEMQFASPVTRPQQMCSGICMYISFPLLGEEERERGRAQREANRGTGTVTHQLLKNTLEIFLSSFRLELRDSRLNIFPVFVGRKQEKCANKSEGCD